MRRFCITVSALLLVTACCIIASAQTTGGVKGKVRNLMGDSIGDLTVTARQDMKEVKAVHSARNGSFVLDGLAPGVYDIVLEAKGYATATKYGVEVKPGKTRELGGSLIMVVDRGSRVIIRGSVFFKDGFGVPGCEVEVSMIGASGETRPLTTLMTGLSGEFSYIRPEGKTTYRFTAKFRGVTASRDLTVDSAAIYTTSVLLPVNRGERQ